MKMKRGSASIFGTLQKCIFFIGAIAVMQTTYADPKLTFGYVPIDKTHQETFVDWHHFRLNKNFAPTQQKLKPIALHTPIHSPKIIDIASGRVLLPYTLIEEREIPTAQLGSTKFACYIIRGENLCDTLEVSEQETLPS